MIIIRINGQLVLEAPGIESSAQLNRRIGQLKVLDSIKDLG